MVTLDLIWASRNQSCQKSSLSDNHSIFWIIKLVSNIFFFIFERQKNIFSIRFFSFYFVLFGLQFVDLWLILEKSYLISFFVLNRDVRNLHFGSKRSKNVLFQVPERCWADQHSSKNGWCSFWAWMQLIFILQFYYNPSSFYLAL